MDARLDQGFALGGRAPDPGVLHEHRPAMFASDTQPVDVVDTLPRLLAVVLGESRQLPSVFTQQAWNLDPSQASVDEELRRLHASPRQLLSTRMASSTSVTLRPNSAATVAADSPA